MGAGAVALVTGRAFVGEYEPPWLDHPQVRRLASLVRLVESPELPFDSEPYVRIMTTAGRSYEGHVDFASGAPQNPLPAQRIVAKFEALAGRTLPAATVAALQDMALAVEDLGDLSEMTRLLRTGSR